MESSGKNEPRSIQVVTSGLSISIYIEWSAKHRPPHFWKVYTNKDTQGNAQNAQISSWVWHSDTSWNFKYSVFKYSGCIADQQAAQTPFSFYHNLYTFLYTITWLPVKCNYPQGDIKANCNIRNTIALIIIYQLIEMADLRFLSNNVWVCSRESVRHTRWYTWSYEHSQCLIATKLPLVTLEQVWAVWRDR